MNGTAGGSLARCTGALGSGDYPQNWYDAGLTVDPNNPDRVFFDTFDTWLMTRGSLLPAYNLTCGYDGRTAACTSTSTRWRSSPALPASS
jgi:hypothetical protein